MEKKFKNVTTPFRNDTVSAKPSDLILNSTAKCNDFLPHNLSTISSISNHNFDFNNELASLARAQKKTLNENCVLTEDKQLEIDNLYSQYLMILYMKENLKKNSRDEEDNVTKEIYELCLADEQLRIEVDELKKELEYKENLLKFLDLIDAMEEPINTILSNINSFQMNHQKLINLCENALNFMPVHNIHMSNDAYFKENLSNELNKTISILKRINELSLMYDLNIEEIINKFDIDLNVLKEILEQQKRLKTLLITQNGLKIMNSY